MADGGWDPCECIFNHEMAMRRLLSLLRNSQVDCFEAKVMEFGIIKVFFAEHLHGQRVFHRWLAWSKLNRYSDL